MHAWDERVRELRRLVLAMIHHAGSGHPGGALSCAELVAYVTDRELGWGRGELSDPSRNRFILSKGHACPALYAAAAHAGIIPYSELGGFRKLGRALQGHPHVQTTPWAETSTGSLGQGFSVAIGMAMGLRYQNSPARVYAMMGDGELQEGEVWEGAMCAAHHALDNLCGIVDYNRMQSDDLNANIMGLEPLADKWQAFGWHVVEADGHSLPEIEMAFASAVATKHKPTLVLAHTVKGKGVSFMEGSPLWHGSVKLRDEELDQALQDLQTPAEWIDAYRKGALWRV